MWERFAIKVLVEVLKEMTHRLGMHDLSEKCAECEVEIPVEPQSEQKEG